MRSAVTRIRHSRRLRQPLNYYRHCALHPKDTFLASYPKSGNTWLKFVLGELICGHELDFVNAERVVPMVGAHTERTAQLPQGGRLLKTHEPWRSEYQRAVLLLRDVRDVLLSQYHYLQLCNQAPGTSEQYIDAFIAGSVSPFGSWAAHTRSWLEAAQRSDQILIVRYEQLLQSPLAVVTEITRHLGLSVRPPAVARAVQHNTFEAMQAKERTAREQGQFSGWNASQTFVREGAAGRGRQALSPDQHQRLLQATGDVLQQAGYAL